MSEPTITPETPEPQSFAAAVIEALTKIGFKPRCSACSCIGWANFNIFGAPIYVPTAVQDQVLPAAGLICQKCGEISTKHLNTIGITLTFDERRVLTASEIAAQQKKPLIVTG